MRLLNIIFAGLFLLNAGAGLSIDGQTTRRKTATPPNTEPSFTQITQEEISLLLEDVGTTNPLALQRMAEDRELRTAQLENLKQLLAFARQAQEDGVAAIPLHSRELTYIRDETIAVNYDRHLKKGRDSDPPFSLISDSQVQAYLGESSLSKLPLSLKRARATGFKEFLDTKVTLLKSGNPEVEDRVVTEDEIRSAKDIYAKINIYADEYAKRSATLPRSLKEKVKLQVKLQQAQFLARLYSEKIVSQSAVSDSEVATFISANPEYDMTAKRALAGQVLGRAKGGEDFAKLANEYSEDPGNKNPQGEPQGGLYENVKKGVMVPSFERAALALEPGQVFPELVESDYGFHIVKLEKKGKSQGADSVETYDVRHILFATKVPGPDGHFMTMQEYVKVTLEKEKEARIIDELVEANKILVPADFTIPAAPVSDAGSKNAAAPASVRKPRRGSARKPN